MALGESMRTLDRVEPAGLECDGGAVWIGERVVQVVGNRAQDDQDHRRHRSSRALPQPGHEDLPAVREEDQKGRHGNHISTGVDPDGQ